MTDITVLSLGAGVQSSVMALMAAKGELPMPDCAIFADTQWEPRGVYEHLDWLESVLPFPVHRVSRGNIKEDHLNGTRGRMFAAFPSFVIQDNGSTGMVGMRSCTGDYKVKEVVKEIRRQLGVGKGERVPSGAKVKQWIGISTDEASRMKPARETYIENCWPLIEQRMSRYDCQNWFSRHYPGRVLAKSACIGCPYHSDTMWREMKLTDPESWQDAVSVDRAMREGVGNNLTGTQFLHRSCKPLDEVDFRNLEDMGQINLFENECEGMCGV